MSSARLNQHSATHLLWHTRREISSQNDQTWLKIHLYICSSAVLSYRKMHKVHLAHDLHAFSLY